jgi:hypothetical protein
VMFVNAFCALTHPRMLKGGCSFCVTPGDRTRGHRSAAPANGRPSARCAAPIDMTGGRGLDDSHCGRPSRKEGESYLAEAISGASVWHGRERGAEGQPSVPSMWDCTDGDVTLLVAPAG